ncbi:MAG TPA: LysR family transcriptional regulator [Candidatus Scatomonas merdigallinarum]|nr:LysR family transcriptional regulator [Candidatus Scatomonas merdigallinarum]
MNLNFEYYKVFYYVSKYGSLTRAASVLMTSQPAVTRTIHNLENEIGCRLFIRSKKGVELTPEGRMFYEYISAACAQIFKGENLLTSMVSLDNGTVCISATETALHCCLFQAVEKFNRQYPNVRFKLLNNSTIDSIQALKAGRIDMAVVSSAPLQVEHPLKIKTLRKYRDILIGGNKFLHLKGKKTSLENLRDYPWISLTSESITRDFLNHYFSEHGLIFDPDIELATTDMILPAVRCNLGIGFIPEEFAEDDVRRGTLFEIPVEEKLPERNIYLIYDTEYPQSIASKTFQNFLAQ